MTFFDKIRANQKITVFAVSAPAIGENFLTFTSSINQATEYIMRILYKEYKTAYQTWCMVNNKEFNDKLSWYQYYDFQICKEDKQKFYIHKLKYRAEDLISVLRMFGGCVPINCSFNTELEYAYFNAIKEDLNVQEGFENAK